MMVKTDGSSSSCSREMPRRDAGDLDAVDIALLAERIDVEHLVGQRREVADAFEVAHRGVDVDRLDRIAAGACSGCCASARASGSCGSPPGCRAGGRGRGRSSWAPTPSARRPDCCRRSAHCAPGCGHACVNSDGAVRDQLEDHVAVEAHALACPRAHRRHASFMMLRAPRRAARRRRFPCSTRSEARWIDSSSSSETSLVGVEAGSSAGGTAAARRRPSRRRACPRGRRGAPGRWPAAGSAGCRAAVMMVLVAMRSCGGIMDRGLSGHCGGGDH